VRHFRAATDETNRLRADQDRLLRACSPSKVRATNAVIQGLVADHVRGSKFERVRTNPQLLITRVQEPNAAHR
jgi:hypothetical protein